MSINGFLNIDKPSGITSAKAVSLLRRWSGQRHIGHAGTLDPMATGVLPICMGQATRLASFITESRKTYRAEVELGVSTDTYDTEGDITRRADPSSVTREQVQALFPSFSGTILQQPPMYSALKHRGERLYRLARSGIEVERPDRKVEVYRLQLIDWQPPRFVMEVECGRGTYIRSLAHDMGQALGCGAHLRGLIRTCCGQFNIADSLSLDRVEDSFRNGCWQELLLPVDTVLHHLSAITLNREAERLVRDGRSIHLGDDIGQSRLRAYSADGRFLAVLRPLPEQGLWQPEKVFSAPG